MTGRQVIACRFVWALQRVLHLEVALLLYMAARRLDAGAPWPGTVLAAAAGVLTALGAAVIARWQRRYEREAKRAVSPGP